MSANTANSPKLISRASLVLCAVVLALTFAGCLWAWRTWGPQVQTQHALQLSLDRLQVTPPPEWVRGNIAEEAFRLGSLGELSLREPDATYKIYRGFELHPWVRSVNRVHKYPDGRVKVDIEYRRPIAWVEIPSRLSPTEEPGVLPIDADAVLLPPSDLAHQLDQFLRISIPDLQPWGVEGAPWNDPRLIGAAQLAALLEGVWRGLGLYRIEAVADQVGGQLTTVYELVTRSGDRILWGSAPGSEQSGEATSLQKIARLKRIISQRGLSESGIVDLRVAARPDSP